MKPDKMGPMARPLPAAPKSSPAWIFLFLVFVAANSLLSYFSLPSGMKIGVGCLGLVLPFVAACFFLKPPAPGRPLVLVEFLPSSPLWFWAVASLGLALRCCWLTTLSVWPHYDEGWIGYYAAHLTHHWDWGFFYGNNQAPPLYTWLLALFFKVLGVSLFTLWLVPALLSALALAPALWACRRLFSASVAFVYFFLLALSFWPWYAGRFSEPTALGPLAEFSVLFCLAFFLKAETEKELKTAAWVLGLALGLYFLLACLFWPGMALLAFSAVAAHLRGRGPRPPLIRALVWRVALPCGLFVLPLAFILWRHGYFQWYSGHSLGDFSLGRQWKDSLTYLSALFWGMDLSQATYQPVWGGFLNPVLGSLFGLGLLEAFQNRRSPFYLWLVLAFGLFLLPGILGSGVETFRILPLLPFLLAFPALGLSRLLLSLSRAKSPWLFALLGLGSLFLDLRHLEKYRQVWDSPGNWRAYAKSPERWKAFDVLQKVRAQQGAGYLFSSFVPGLSDQTLWVSAYSFNAAANPALQASDARWVALLANANDLPFLARRFPQGKAYNLSPDFPPDGGWMLWICPLDSFDSKLLGEYRQAEEALRPFIEGTLNRFAMEDESGILQSLEEAHPAFESDPLLDSFYWEKLSDICIRFSFRHQGEDRDRLRRKAQEALEKAVQDIPSAHLYFHLGSLELMEGRGLEARKDFQRAVKAPLNLTQAAGYLSP